MKLHTKDQAPKEGGKEAPAKPQAVRAPRACSIQWRSVVAWWHSSSCCCRNQAATSQPKTRAQVVQSR